MHGHVKKALRPNGYGEINMDHGNEYTVQLQTSYNDSGIQKMLPKEERRTSTETKRLTVAASHG
jgi:hypothetical protein